jgi:hypothetical protein
MLVELGPDTANCEGEIDTPVMFNVAVPVFLIATAWEELVVLMAMEPNPSDVGVTVPWAVPVGELATVSVKVTDPYVPLRVHARIMT